jgi:hypothetical protein
MLTLLGVFIVLSFHDAIETRWFFKMSPEDQAARAREFFPGTTHFFPVGAHWGWWAAIPLTGLLAWAFAESSPRWSAPILFIVALLSSIVALLAMRSWAIADNDSDPAKHVLSGFAINGSFTVPGLCLTFTMAFTYTIAVMYFLSPGPTDTWFPFIFAVALTIALAVGLLQPPLYVWGSIHLAAWAQSLFFAAAVWGLYYAHKFGLVIPV